MKKDWAEEDIVKYKYLKEGHTNKSYFLKTKINSYFYQIFCFDKYNHKINYSLLKDFVFVPRIFYSSKKELITQYIKNEKLVINDVSLKAFSQILKKTHESKKKFSKCNINKRIKYYYKIVKNKPSLPIEVIKYKKWILLLEKSLKKDTPCHNDPWIKNFIYNQKKFYLSDWEYATMNNKHFDLAYIITSSYLTKYEEELFLKSYGSYDKKELDICKIIVLYITVLWIFKQKVIPFPYKPLLKQMNILIKKSNIL